MCIRDRYIISYLVDISVASSGHLFAFIGTAVSSAYAINTSSLLNQTSICVKIEFLSCWCQKISFFPVYFYVEPAYRIVE